MSKRRASSHLTATALASVLLLSSEVAYAQAQPQGQTEAQTSETEGQAQPNRRSTTFLDLEAGLGFSSNPFLQFNNHSSIFGRLSASGTHQWASERGVTAITGYVENTTYFRGGYGSKQIFDVGARTNQALSETVTMYGDLNFSGDFAGQLSNRLISGPALPPPPDPNNPLPPPTTNYPDLFGLSGRQYRVTGDLGTSIRTGLRGTVSLSIGAQHSWFTGASSDLNYTSIYGSGGYSSQVSERTSVGVTVFLQRQDYTHGDWANIVNPVVTVSTKLSESLTATGAAGVMAINQQSLGDNRKSVTPSFSGSLCSRGTESQFCVQVARDAQSALSSSVLNGQREATINTSLTASYFRTLSRNDSIQASLTAVHYSSAESINGDKLTSSYASGVVGYDRHVGHRLFAGVEGGVRKLFQTGPDPKLDFNASVYVRYRLGDLL
jgi:hypothetical protein